MQIKSCSEIPGFQNQQIVNNLSKYGLNLLHYALFAIENQQVELPLTSVSAGAAMADVVYELTPLAKAYGATIAFDSSPSLDPVYANETSLKGSVYALVSGLLTGINSSGNNTHITIAVQQTKPKEQRIGIYSNNIPINPSLLKRRLGLLKQSSRMGMPSVTHRSGLGFAVSRELTERLNTKYHSFDHLDNKGVGFYLPESAQLQLL